MGDEQDSGGVGELGQQLVDVLPGPWVQVGGGLVEQENLGPAGQGPSGESFEDAMKRWAAHRVRTLAVEFGIGPDKGKGEIEAFLERVDAQVWAEVTAAGGRKDKPLLGYRFASRVPVPDTVIDLWRDLLLDLGLI